MGISHATDVEVSVSVYRLDYTAWGADDVSTLVAGQIDALSPVVSDLSSADDIDACSASPQRSTKMEDCSDGLRRDAPPAHLPPSVG